MESEGPGASGGEGVKRRGDSRRPDGEMGTSPRPGKTMTDPGRIGILGTALSSEKSQHVHGDPEHLGAPPRSF